MAQSAITVTPPNPTPPTNMSFLGTTPPTAPAQTVDDDGPALTWDAFAAQAGTVDAVNFPSAAPEGRGTEVVWTAASAMPGPYGQLQAFSCLGSYTATPNAQHASSLSPVTNPALASITPTTAVKGTGTQLITCTGTNFTPGCRIWVDNQERTTTFVSATSLTTTVPKSSTATTWPVDVKIGGVAVPSTRTFTWT